MRYSAHPPQQRHHFGVILVEGCRAIRAVNRYVTRSPDILPHTQTKPLQKIRASRLYSLLWGVCPGFLCQPQSVTKPSSLLRNYSGLACCYPIDPDGVQNNASALDAGMQELTHLL
jgi:hypothetical protein